MPDFPILQAGANVYDIFPRNNCIGVYVHERQELAVLPSGLYGFLGAVPVSYPFYNSSTTIPYAYQYFARSGGFGALLDIREGRYELGSYAWLKSSVNSPRTITVINPGQYGWFIEKDADLIDAFSMSASNYWGAGCWCGMPQTVLPFQKHFTNWRWGVGGLKDAFQQWQSINQCTFEFRILQWMYDAVRYPGDNWIENIPLPAGLTWVLDGVNQYVFHHRGWVGYDKYDNPAFVLPFKANYKVLRWSTCSWQYYVKRVPLNLVVPTGEPYPERLPVGVPVSPLPLPVMPIIPVIPLPLPVLPLSLGVSCVRPVDGDYDE